MPARTTTPRLTTGQRDALLTTLRTRFEANMGRHPGVRWDAVLTRLNASPEALGSLHAMEESGGEPDVVASKGKSYRFVDCAKESPAGRRSCCYDDEALEARKANKPKQSAMGMAEAMGVELLDEAEYRALQALGACDTKTSSWLRTPPAIRALGGAIFGDYRFDTIFVYHNGAESYYAARGFRGGLWV